VVRSCDGDGSFDAGYGQVTRLLPGDDLCGLLGGSEPRHEDPTMLLQSMSRFFKFLPGEQRQAFLHEVAGKVS
jgi:hypothetical protein